jgi:SET domain
VYCRISSRLLATFWNSQVCWFVFTSSVDATKELDHGPKLGRLINHSRKSSVIPRVTVIDGRPHICFYASKNLATGEQVLFNYGVQKLPFEDLVLLVS